MKFVVDSNILSKLSKPRPNQQVVQSIQQHEHEIAADPIVLGEIRFGILLLPPGKKRTALESWFEEGIQHLPCLRWDFASALRRAELRADLRAAGLEMPVKGSLIAATALGHGLTVVTRNTKDFKKADVAVLNPFDLPIP